MGVGSTTGATMRHVPTPKAPFSKKKIQMTPLPGGAPSITQHLLPTPPPPRRGIRKTVRTYPKGTIFSEKDPNDPSSRRRPLYYPAPPVPRRQFIPFTVSHPKPLFKRYSWRHHSILLSFISNVPECLMPELQPPDFVSPYPFLDDDDDDNDDDDDDDDDNDNDTGFSDFECDCIPESRPHTICFQLSQFINDKAQLLAKSQKTIMESLDKHADNYTIQMLDESINFRVKIRHLVCEVCVYKRKLMGLPQPADDYAVQRLAIHLDDFFFHNMHLSKDEFKAFETLDKRLHSLFLPRMTSSTQSSREPILTSHYNDGGGNMELQETVQLPSGGKNQYEENVDSSVKMKNKLLRSSMKKQPKNVGSSLKKKYKYLKKRLQEFEAGVIVKISSLEEENKLLRSSIKKQPKNVGSSLKKKYKYFKKRLQEFEAGVIAKISSLEEENKLLRSSMKKQPKNVGSSLKKKYKYLKKRLQEFEAGVVAKISSLEEENKLLRSSMKKQPKDVGSSLKKKYKYLKKRLLEFEAGVIAKISSLEEENKLIKKTVEQLEAR